VSRAFEILAEDRVFNLFVRTCAVVVTGFMVLNERLPFRYGRTYVKGTAGSEVKDRLAFILLHASGPIVYLLSRSVYQAR
jgi:hypothetical protein